MIEGNIVNKQIAIVANSPPNTGSGRYAFMLQKLLRDKMDDLTYIYIDKSDYSLNTFDDSSSKIIAKAKKIPLIDNRTYFYYRLGKKIPEFPLYHITTQNLSFLKLYPRVITVLDLIHYVQPETKLHFLLSNYLYKGLKDEKHTLFISISNHTKKDLINHFKIPSDKIKVTYLGVDIERYRLLSKSEIIQTSQKLNVSISENKKYILYVGSEHPRKNIPAIIKALYKLKKKYEMNVTLIKVGSEEHKKQKELISSLIQRLNLEKGVISIKDVPEEVLPLLYNTADLFVYPSFYEGFGLPPLEAMACGTPVITSNTSSLPEVVGDAGIMVDPYDVDGLADAMHEVLTNSGLMEEMIKKGLERAKMFSWERCARETSKVYEELHNI